MAARAARLDETPDAPRPFERHGAWLAVRSRDVAAVARALQLRTSRVANWQSGLDGAKEGLFVAAHGDYVCAIGRDAWQQCDPDALERAVTALSRTFGEAFWFGIDADEDTFGWAAARGGVLLRAYACRDGEPAIWWDEGAVTAAESELGFFVADPRDRSDDPVKWWPHADEVRKLAARWSVDPRPRGGAPATGLLGRW